MTYKKEAYCTEDAPINVDFAIALRELPEVPSEKLLCFLSEVASGVSDVGVIKDLGLKVQSRHGTDRIAPNSETEIAAGFWALIRSSIKELRDAQNK